MKVSALYPGTGVTVIPDQDVYVVGLGPSMRIYPPKALEDNICILLNDAWTRFPTLGPFVFSNSPRFVEDADKDHRTVIVKGRNQGMPDPERDDNEVPWHHPRWHVFSFKDERFDGESQHDELLIFDHDDHYYSARGGTVAEYACQFAVRAGARKVILVGIDCRSFAGGTGQRDHYESDVTESTRTAFAVNKNWKADRDYSNHARGLVAIQRAAWERYKVPIVSETPFIGLGREDEQYASRRTP